MLTVLKKNTLGKLYFTFFRQNISTVIYTEGGYALSWKQNFIHLKTCSHHDDILAKTRIRMTTAITFSRQNDAGSRVSKTQDWENLLLVIVLVSESKALQYLLTGDQTKVDFWRCIFFCFKLDLELTDTLENKGGAVVRALVSRQCEPGSNPGVDAICGLS